jgi:hypothetical protein
MQALTAILTNSQNTVLNLNTVARVMAVCLPNQAAVKHATTSEERTLTVVGVSQTQTLSTRFGS